MFTLADNQGIIMVLYYGFPNGNRFMEQAADKFVAAYGMNGIRTILPVDYLD